MSHTTKLKVAILAWLAARKGFYDPASVVAPDVASPSSVEGALRRMADAGLVRRNGAQTAPACCLCCRQIIKREKGKRVLYAAVAS